MKSTTEIASSTKLSSGLARPPVTAVEAARSADLAACGTRADGAPTAVPSTTEVSGSVTVPEDGGGEEGPRRGAQRRADHVERVVDRGDLVADELDGGGHAEQHERLVRGEELEGRPEVEDPEPRQPRGEEERQPRPQPGRRREGDGQRERGQELGEGRDIHASSLGPPPGGVKERCGSGVSVARKVSTLRMRRFT